MPSTKHNEAHLPEEALPLTAQNGDGIAPPIIDSSSSYAGSASRNGPYSDVNRAVRSYELHSAQSTDSLRLLSSASHSSPDLSARQSRMDDRQNMGSAASSRSPSRSDPAHLEYGQSDEHNLPQGRTKRGLSGKFSSVSSMLHAAVTDDKAKKSRVPVVRRKGFWMSVVGVVLVIVGVVLAVQMVKRKDQSTPADPSVLMKPPMGANDVQRTIISGTIAGDKIKLEDVVSGVWRPKSERVSWIESLDGHDGLLLERQNDATGDIEKGDVFLSVRSIDKKDKSGNLVKVLMKTSNFSHLGEDILTSNAWPSKDWTKVLIQSDRQQNWRYSTIGRYWVFDVETQTAEPLDAEHFRMSDNLARIRLASWSPNSKVIAFTREADMNIYTRTLPDPKVRQVTYDGGAELFYGVPDWVYEEEVVMSNIGTWWSPDGNKFAFLRTDESAVPEIQVPFYLSRPSGKVPPAEEETYPDLVMIKYPRPGTPNPVVNVGIHDTNTGRTVNKLQFGDEKSKRGTTDFLDSDRIVSEVVWTDSDSLLVRETSRESDILKIVLANARDGSAEVVRELNMTAQDGGWVETTHKTFIVPADPERGRPEAGYIETLPLDGYNHLAYFSPVSSSEPVFLTSGSWEVVEAPSAVDLKNNIVYFSSTQDGTRDRHFYYTSLLRNKEGGIDDPVRFTNITGGEGYYSASFSTESGYALLNYQGPGIPWQKVISTPVTDSANLKPSTSEKVDWKPSFELLMHDNAELRELASNHSLPTINRGTVMVNGLEMNFVERLPANFQPTKKYPVLFHNYQGPNSQSVDSRWNIDFQAFVAASLGYVVVTVDGRGTGYKGREFKCVIRGKLGVYEAEDQIAAAKVWADRDYVNPDKMAIWGWSFGGFTTLKALELDGGETFKYGVAVAPVTDWALYDTIYTERYMWTPQHNPDGYKESAVNDVHRLAKNVRFLMMHGVADDNVNYQNMLILSDKLNLAGQSNYDVHVFPDSNHGIYFHNANQIVYRKLRDWMVNAFNGAWLTTDNPTPNPIRRDVSTVL